MAEELHGMHKKLVNQKRDELKKLSQKDFIDRICAYPNQDLLNLDDDGEQRRFPVGDMAKWIQKTDYQMSDKQYYTLVHHFAAITVPEEKVVGITFRPNNAGTFARKMIEQDGSKATYEVNYRLQPEPENPYDENACMVLAQQEDDEWHHLGYLPRVFVAEHRIWDTMDVDGYMTDHSNGKFKNVSYYVPMDVEEIDLHPKNMIVRTQDTGLDLTDDDLEGLDNSSTKVPYVYQTNFSLECSVIDYDAAKAYLDEESKDMTEALHKHIQYDTKCGVRHEDAVDDFSAKINSIVWVLDDEISGHITMETNTPLTAEEKAYLSEWIGGQNADGIGEGFEQQPFACYDDPDYDPNDYDEDEYEVPAVFMASFDYDRNNYPLTLVSGPEQEESKETVMKEENDLGLTDADLAFAEQLSLSDFGLS